MSFYGASKPSTKRSVSTAPTPNEARRRQVRPISYPAYMRPRSTYVPQASSSSRASSHRPAPPSKQTSLLPLLERPLYCPSFDTVKHVLHDWSRKWFTHVLLIALLVGYCFLGGYLFRHFELGHEQAQKNAMLEAHRELLGVHENLTLHYVELITEHLWQKVLNMNIFSNDQFNVDDSLVAELDTMLNRYQLLTIESGLDEPNLNITSRHDLDEDWNLMGSVFFAATIITTIGYGHIAPKTLNGRCFCMAYAVIGMPILLIVLTDIGKLFTRAIKYVWSFARRFYQLRAIKKLRSAVHDETAIVRETAQKGADLARKGADKAMDIGITAVEKTKEAAEKAADTVTGRKKSIDTTIEETGFDAKKEETKKAAKAEEEASLDGDDGTMVEFVVDDEFNLPISIALLLMVIYMFIGAVIFTVGEKDWDYLTAFYFCFISLSTIGLGDVVPKDKAFHDAMAGVYVLLAIRLSFSLFNGDQLS
ncbi:PREDICTED: potassium channel subfamily K member 18-like [Priapulus caudatus]|uniref:Potassium channel subfamily K member 18-like n=1 Tax=Priapulus caudatus TaxID=37621 RepID=A0ABM1DQD2_PRICU|nr:PREDICTED: potassium channel subfamily K member 18-like [Priapulus caudatus]